MIHELLPGFPIAGTNGESLAHGSLGLFAVSLLAMGNRALRSPALQRKHHGEQDGRESKESEESPEVHGRDRQISLRSRWKQRTEGHA